jgi:hypothetical protein
MKTEDVAIREEISRMGPHESKRRSREFELRADWDEIKLDVMACALQHKFKQGTTWRAKLMATEGPIIETNNWHDNFWGNCVCGKQKCRDPGLNHLGKILENLRT